MFSQKVLITSLALLLTIMSWGQKPRFKDKKVAKNVQSHINYLTSDDLAGRYIATLGEKMSADYIATQFEQIGLDADGDNGYLQQIGIPNLRMAEAKSSLSLSDKALTLFTDFYPINISANNGQYTGEAVNLGYGIDDPGLKQENYKGKDIKGKAVIINLDIPGGINEHNRFMAWEGAEMRAKYAISKGAVVVLYHTTNKDLIPKGTLEKTLEHAGKPILFVKRDLGKKDIPKIDLSLHVMLITVSAHNVVGKVNNNANHTIILAAHHDHLGAGNTGKTQPEYKNQIHRGADNNASGVAALIELAREIKSKPKKYANHNYIFVALTGAEENSLGAKYYTKSNSFNTIEPSYMLNLDMVGHLDSTTKELSIEGVGTSTLWKDALTNTKICKRKIKSINTTYLGSKQGDTYSFNMKGIPSLNITTSIQEYTNTPNDVASVINYGGEAFIIRYAKKLICNLDEVERLDLVKTVTEEDLSSNLKVSLGVVPNLSYKADGILVGDLEESSIAQKAGILQGDIIVQIDNSAVLDLQAYINALTKVNIGDTSSVTIVRGKETKTLPLQF